MNKKKIASLLLVGTLLIGGGVLGAKAWFTSNAKVTSNLQVTMGTLKLEVQGDDIWTVGNQTGNTDEITEITNKTEGNNFINVRPGDDFTKTVTLKNEGTLKSRTTIKIDEKIIPDNLKDKVVIEIFKGTEKLEQNSEIIMAPRDQEGSQENISVKVSLDGPKMENEFQNRSEDGTAIGTLHEDLVKFLNSDSPFIQIEGIQVNAKK